MNEKKVLNGDDSLALIPIKYKYAWDFFQNSKKNFWKPQDIAIGDDIYCFKSKLNSIERHVFLNVFAQLSTMDIAAGDVINKLAIQVTSPEHKIALGAQCFSEGIHSESYAYCAEHLGMDEEWLWNRWKDVSQIKAKIDMTRNVVNSNLFNLVEKYFFLTVIFESGWFMCGFNPIFALARNNKVKRVSEMLAYIARDEQTHVGLGLNTIKSILKENKSLVTTRLNDNLISLTNTAYILEKDYIKYIFSKGSYMGYSVEEHLAHLSARFIMGLKALNMDISGLELYPNPEFPSWVSEMILLQKDTAIFEKHNIEYQKTALSFDEEIEGPKWDDILK